jgi:hypothetical protein
VRNAPACASEAAWTQRCWKHSEQSEGVNSEGDWTSFLRRGAKVAWVYFDSSGIVMS